MRSRRIVPLHRQPWLLAVLLPLSAFAQTAPAPAAVDPVVVTALDKMGTALRALEHFRLTSDASTEIVLDSGQKVELDSQVKYQVQRPNRISVDINSDRKHRQLFYDGKQLTLFAPRLKYYASVDGVHATLAEVVEAAAEHDIEFPLADLFFWGTPQAPASALTAALDVGPATLDGEKVEQYALRQEGVDWQVWISQETSLPKKLVITSLDDPALPQYTAHLHWDTRSKIDSKAFTFVPPDGAARIVLAPVEVVAINTDKKEP